MYQNISAIHLLGKQDNKHTQPWKKNRTATGKTLTNIILCRETKISYTLCYETSSFLKKSGKEIIQREEAPSFMSISALVIFMAVELTTKIRSSSYGFFLFMFSI